MPNNLDVLPEGEHVRSVMRGLTRLGLVAAVAVSALLLGAEAWAYHEESGPYNFYSGSLTSGEGQNYGPDGPCWTVNYSIMLWNTDGGYGLVRIIRNSDGAIMNSNESQSGSTAVGAFPIDGPADDGTWKANCRNSTPWQITHYGVTCAYKKTASHDTCI